GRGGAAAMTGPFPAAAALAGLVIVTASTTPRSRAQLKKAEADQAAAVAALKRLGGEVGTFEVIETGEIHFKLDKGDKADPKKLPVLHFPGADDKLLSRLPKSDAAVGLDLRGTKVGDAGMKAVANLKGLQLIALGNTGIGDDGLKELFSCKELLLLDLSGTKVKSDALRQLDQFKDLRALDLSRCGAATDKGVRDLGLVKELRSLNLEKTRVTD